MERSEWMGDWFMSYSPRNDNSNAEGQWDQWVSLALQILQHPATRLVRPEAHAAVQELDPKRFYSEVERGLTEEEVVELFGEVQP
jgi:hypothetical protein